MQQIENMKEFCIQENDSDQRLDRFLQKTLPELPKSLCYKWIRTKHIKVNRKRCTPDQRLVTGDVVTLFVSDSYFTIKTEEERSGIPEFMQAPDQLDILYEDAQILMVNKPVGLVVHCDSRRSRIRWSTVFSIIFTEPAPIIRSRSKVLRLRSVTAWIETPAVLSLLPKQLRRSGK